MDILTYLARNFGRIWFLLVQHVELVLVSVSIGTVIALALAVLSERMPRLQSALLSVAGLILTIPSLALFGLMIPLLGLGVGPTVFVLTLYSIFPILRNAVTGLHAVSPAIIDAARGMGMTRRDRLLRVRLPLAWPVILTGIRLSTIMLVATAAIGAAVRGPGLGTLIFRGLSRMGGANALNEALAGVIGVIVVALALDLIFQLVGRLTTPRGLDA